MEKPSVDFVEAGSGPTVVLIHSSVAGAGQWRSLMMEAANEFRFLAINLMGYGETPAWQGPQAQTLEDQARLIEPLLPSLPPTFCVVGHSFGGSVAMKLAALFPDRVERLVLIEPNPFYLLKEQGRVEAYQEAIALRACIKSSSDAASWAKAAETFADYWTGAGSWASMNEARQQKFIAALKPNFYEWDGVMNEQTTLDGWRDALRMKTTLFFARDTVRTIREIVTLLSEACPDWRKIELPEGGHMAPLTRADVFNPILLDVLKGARD